MLNIIKLYLWSVCLFVSFLQSLEVSVAELCDSSFLEVPEANEQNALMLNALKEQENAQSIVIASHLKSGWPSIGAFLRSICCCCCDTEEGDDRRNKDISRPENSIIFQLPSNLKENANSDCLLLDKSLFHLNELTKIKIIQPPQQKLDFGSSNNNQLYQIDLSY